MKGYACRNKKKYKCKAYVRADPEGRFFLSGEHNHQNDEAALSIAAENERLRGQILATSSISQIVQQVDGYDLFSFLIFYVFII